MKDLTMDDVKRNNKEAGRYFFSPDTMKFFKSKIESKLLKGRFFITSEQAGDEHSREFTIRVYDTNTHKISTMGGFQAYKTKEEAELKIADFAYNFKF